MDKRCVLLFLVGLIPCLVTSDTYNCSRKTSETVCCANTIDTICYTVISSNDWDGAFESCKNLSEIPGVVAAGGVMVSIYDEEIQNRVAGLLENATDLVWIAARTEDPKILEANDQSQWRWVYECDKCDTMAELNQYALEHQGCYKSDEASVPDLRNNVGSVHNVSICKDSCGNAPFSGLKFPDQVCACDETFGTFGVSWGCTQECDGNCGGYGTNFIYRLNGNFGPWAYNEPDNGKDQKGVEFCASTDLANRFDAIRFPYSDERCDLSRPYICDFDTPGPCGTSPGIGTLYNTTFGTCVYISDLTEADTWYRSRMACWDMGADLVSFDNLAQHHEVLDEARGFLGNQNVYIGLYREAVVWKRVYREVEMNYYNFSVGHPNFTSTDRCVVMDPGDDYRWKSENCAASHTTLCYQGPDMDPDPTTTAPPSDTTAVQDTTESTVPLVGPSTPAPSTKKLSQTEIILIAVLVPMGVILIILFILLMIRVCRKNDKDKVAPTPDVEGPISREKVDARLQATKPQSGPIGEVDEGYYDMGSTANLIFSVKSKVLPKWKSAAKKSARPETEIPDEPPPTTLRRDSKERVLIPDYSAPGEHLDEGRYEFEGLPEVTHYDVREGSIEPLISYGSIPGQTDLPESPAHSIGRGSKDLMSMESFGVASADKSSAHFNAQDVNHDNVHSSPIQSDAQPETNLKPEVAPPLITSDLGSSREVLDQSHDLSAPSVEYSEQVHEAPSGFEADNSPRGSDSPLMDYTTDNDDVMMYRKGVNPGVPINATTSDADDAKSHGEDDSGRHVKQEKSDDKASDIDANENSIHDTDTETVNEPAENVDNDSDASGRHSESDKPEYKENKSTKHDSDSAENV